MATTSFGSSTTQMTATSRRGSRQMRHCSSSATLPQIVQNRTLSLTSVRAETRRRTSTGSAASRWKAMRCALFGPTPGSRPSSSMRSWTAPSYISEARQAHAAEATGERAHLLLRQIARSPGGVTHRGNHEVLKRLDVVGVDGLRVDGQGRQLSATGHRRPDEPAARASLDLDGGELLLRGHQLLLHLLRLLHELLHVRLRWHAVSLRVGEGQTASISPITCAPRSRCKSETALASPVSVSSGSSLSRSTTSAPAGAPSSAGGAGSSTGVIASDAGGAATGAAGGGGGASPGLLDVLTMRSMPATTRNASRKKSDFDSKLRPIAALLNASVTVRASTEATRAYSLSIA